MDLFCKPTDETHRNCISASFMNRAQRNKAMYESNVFYVSITFFIIKHIFLYQMAALIYLYYVTSLYMGFSEGQPNAD